jgi:hypothetical protein
MHLLLDGVQNLMDSRDQLPPVDCPLNSAPHPTKDASVVKVTVGVPLFTGEDLCKFNFHQLISPKAVSDKVI